MINQVSYDMNTLDGPAHITITPIIQSLPNGDFYETGVYKLTDGTVGMGNITFNEDRSDWEYDGIGELTYEEAANVAGFIKNYKDPAGDGPKALR